MTVQKMLIAVDGSSNSLRAVAYAARRVRADPKLRILLLNVQSPLPASTFVTRTMIKAHHALQSKSAMEPVRKMLARIDLNTDNYVRIGEPARTIVEFAREKRCGEIVMGTRGLGGLKRLLLGSVATKVIHLARIPITVVP